MTIFSDMLAIKIVEELNARLEEQEHPIRATDGRFSVSTDGYDVAISFSEFSVLDDNTSWEDEDEDNCKIGGIVQDKLLMLLIMKRELYQLMDEVEAATNVIEKMMFEDERNAKKQTA